MDYNGIYGMYSSAYTCMVIQANPSAWATLHQSINEFLLAVSFIRPYLFDMFVVAVALVLLSLLKTTSGNTSSVLSAFLTPKGLPRSRKNLMYVFRALGVRPNREKNTTAVKGPVQPFQYTEITDHLFVDHIVFGTRTGSQFEWMNVHPW